MSEHLVIVQTFPNLLQADDAQVELQEAGIYSLLVAEGEPPANAPFDYTVALAVHRRDAEIAWRFLERRVGATG